MKLFNLRFVFKFRKNENFLKDVSCELENNLVDLVNKLAVLVGIKDLCMIDTNSTLLTSCRQQLDKIKEALEIFNTNDHEQYL